MTTGKNIEYILGKTGSRKYQQLGCACDSSAIVRRLSMYGFGDCVGFQKRNDDGSAYGSGWGLHNLSCFRELQNYTRLIDMPQEGIVKLAARMYELLYLDTSDEAHYRTIPIIDSLRPEYCQIQEELKLLQRTERELVGEGKIVFPGVSAEELGAIDSW